MASHWHLISRLPWTLLEGSISRDTNELALLCKDPALLTQAKTWCSNPLLLLNFKETQKPRPSKPSLASQLLPPAAGHNADKASRQRKAKTTFSAHVFRVLIPFFGDIFLLHPPPYLKEAPGVSRQTSVPVSLGSRLSQRIKLMAPSAQIIPRFQDLQTLLTSEFYTFRRGRGRGKANTVPQVWGAGSSLSLF